MESNDRILQRVRALLAKAESTTFAEEATSLTAKAHELIAAHAIDLALIEEQQGRGEVVTRVIFVSGPYVKEKFVLLSGVARANRSRAILGLRREDLMDLVAEQSDDYFDGNGEHASLVGYSSDLDAIELLFTSLLVQAVNVMLAHGSQIGAFGQNRTKSFRRSFLAGFAWSVGERLKETRDAASEAAASVDRAVSVLPVLASREQQVDEHIDAEFGKLSNLSTSISNQGGVVAGAQAGRSADLGRERVGKTPAALR